MTRARTLSRGSNRRAGRLVRISLWACLAAAGSTDLSADPEILRAVDTSPSLETNLRQLCDELGARPAGTPAMKRAAQWSLDRFQEAGVDSVWLEPFDLPRRWTEIRTVVRVLSPVAFEARAISTAWSPSTGESAGRLELVLADGLGEGSVSRLGQAARGRAVLVLLDEAKTFFAMGLQQSHAIRAMREAGEAGAAAVLFASFKPNRVLFRHTHTVDATVDPAPSVVVAREDALRIGRLLQDGAVTVEVGVEVQVDGPTRAANVVAEIRGDDPSEVVILGAHLDSWDLGQGCLDNGVNVAGVIEAARAISASGRRPRRTIRFILFDGEEPGLFGSRAYVRQHSEQLDSIAAVVVHDMGQGRIEGYALGGRPELEEGLRDAMSRIDEARSMRHRRDAFLGSDHFDFQLEGIPALVAIQNTGTYVLPYHSEVDAYDKVNLAQVRARARVAAATIFGLAQRPERIGPRLDRQEVDAMLERTGLENQMKFLLLWDDWESGERGRRKD